MVSPSIVPRTERKKGPENIDFVPIRPRASHDPAMPRPRVMVQYIQRRDDSPSKRIQVNIPGHLSKVRFGANEPGFVPVLEKMPDTLMTGIEIFRVTRKQASHEGR